MRIAVVGGTGSFGRALASALRDVGHDVVVGSRDADRAAAAAAALGAEGATNEEAVRGADLIVLAVKADAMLATAEELAESIGTTPTICVGSELDFGPGGARPASAATSLAERVQERLEAPVVACLHSIAASNLDEGRPEEDALVVGDDQEAKELVLGVCRQVVAGNAIDAGPLAGARTLEGLTAVIVNVNRRYKTHAGVRLTGVA